MHASRVRETTTTSGTGNLTLLGAAANCVTIASQFELENPVRYYVKDDANATWERGVGYLSASTTFVREIVKENHLGTTALVNFSGATKDIYVDHAPGKWDNLYSGSNRIMPSQMANSSGTFTALANEMVVYPFEIPIYGDADAFQCIVTTAVAASKARIGFFRKNTSGGPGVVLVQTADLDTTTTGLKTGAITWKLRPGEYLAALVANAAVGFAASNTGAMVPSSLGGHSDNGDGVIIASFRCNLTAGWAAIPSSPTIAYAPRSAAGATPIIMVRKTA